MNELISVIITTHNREALLERAIRSVIAQTYPAVELVIVDDCS
ncbi:TPA: glycosyltransferase, partial [Enterobacter roggenkampii]|nr:glycosyltransferase [Enterobacter roggenkampii]